MLHVVWPHYMYDGHSTYVLAIIRVRLPQYVCYGHDTCAMAVGTCTMAINDRSTCMMAITHVFWPYAEHVPWTVDHVPLLRYIKHG